MKVYFHMNLDSFSNCYVVVNDKEKKALIVDPGKLRKEMIDQIEDGGYQLVGALITHNHPGHIQGLNTLKKIYDVTVYAADYDIAGSPASVIKGDGTIKVAGLNVSYFALPGHTPDSMVYKIGNVLFTGDTISAGRIGETNSSYSHKTLITGLKTKILTQQEDTLIMSGHGPLTSVGAERMFNMDLQDN